MANLDSAGRRVAPFTIMLWSLAAIVEGIDLQSAGIAGPGIAAQFGFAPEQMLWVFTAGTLGIVFGAGLGGRIADTTGRKPVLIASIVLYGIFSLASAQAWDHTTLILCRFLTGLGLGGALPNLVALAAESTEEKSRNTIIGLMYCSMPFGSAVIAAIGWMWFEQLGWQGIFYTGGIAPLLVAPVLWAFLPESPVFLARKMQSGAAAATQSVPTALFDNGRVPVTLALWLACFCTYFVLYMLLSWLPTLLVGQGFSRAGASGVMILFNLGGMVGIFTGGLLMDRVSRGFVIVSVYLGLIAALIAMTLQTDVAILLVAAFAADFFITCTQMVQYSLGPVFYGSRSRGTGLGAMVAAGRFGSVVGPFTAGKLLAAGAGTSVVLMMGVPGLVLAGLALLGILSRPPAKD